jgi:hypothetical protein
MKKANFNDKQQLSLPSKNPNPLELRAKSDILAALAILSRAGVGKAPIKGGEI